MQMIRNVLKNTRASRLWFSAAVMFIAILNVSAVEAKSLKTGDEFKEKEYGYAIRVISSDEVEIDGQGNSSYLGKYTVDGERVRVVYGMLGSSVVQYYRITPDGLVEERGGKIYYSKAALAAKENMVKAALTKERKRELFSKIVKFTNEFQRAVEKCGNDIIFSGTNNPSMAACTSGKNGIPANVTNPTDLIASVTTANGVITVKAVGSATQTINGLNGETYILIPVMTGDGVAWKEAEGTWPGWN